MIAVIIVSIVFRNVMAAHPIEEDLHLSLFQSYDPNYKSYRNGNTYNLTFDIALSKLIKLNEKNEVIHLFVWIRQYWQENHLQWNASDWGGITSVTVAPNRLWKPDITLYNNADKEFQGLDNYGKTKITVNSDGAVMWLIPTILQSSCKIDTSYFPFDEQKCLLTFGSWAHDYRGIDIYPGNSKGDLSKYNTNGQFVISGFDATRRIENFTCCPYPFVTLTYEIIIQRRAKYYLYKTILPGVLIALLSCFSFVIPPVTGERAGFVLANFLSLSVYVLIASDSVPATSDSLPLLVIFYTILLFVIGFALTTSCLVCSLCEKTVPVPKWLKVIILENHFGSLCNMIKRKCCSNKRRPFINEPRIRTQVYNNNLLMTNRSPRLTNRSPRFHNRQFMIHSILDRNNLDLQEINGITKRLEINEISYLKRINEYLINFNLKESIRSDWEEIAYALDKLLLAMFMMLIGICILFIFTYPPKVVL